MNDFFNPWIAMNRQLLEAHKANVDTVFRSIETPGLDGVAKVARGVADAQITAWENWLAMLGPRG